jgi:two-component system chemotaxis response regulator CheB
MSVSIRRIKVLIAEDSGVMRALLVHLLRGDPALEIIGIVEDGQAALDFVINATERPDVVLMDIHMPRLDGFEATRLIMEAQALPIVICTATSDPKELEVAFRSMEAGAVACVEKPVSSEHPEFEVISRNLLQTLRLMSEVKVVRRWPRPRGPAPLSNTGTFPVLASRPVVGIGASTGGPPVLQTILSGLSKDFPAPLLIVQHIARGFLPGLVDWLNQTTGLHVHVAAHGALLQPGHAYIAPDDFHLGIGAGGRALLAREAPENGVRPAVSYLFRSLAQTCGASAVGVLLTGMGKDGAAELKAMRERGAWTIAQDRDSSVVHGMPGEAILLDAAAQVLPADRIAAALLAHVRRRKGTPPA